MISDPMNQAIEEALGKKVEDSNGVHIFYHYFQKMDAAGNNIVGAGDWAPCLRIFSAAHRNQQVHRKLTDDDKLKYPTKWAQFQAGISAELAAKEKYLAEQLASLRALTEPVAKRRGRPPRIPQGSQGVAAYAG